MFGRKEEYILHEKKPKKRKSAQTPMPAPMSASVELSAPEDRSVAWGTEEEAPDAVDAMLEEVAGREASRVKREKKPKTAGAKVPFWKSRKAMGKALIGLSLIMSLLVAPALSYLDRQETATVVAAAVAVNKGTAITAEMLSEKVVNADAVLPIQQQTLAAVVGKYAKSDIVADEIISAPKLTAEPPLCNAYLYTLPMGKKAMSVSMGKLSESVSGKLEAGDVVSVYVAVDSNNADVRAMAQQPPELTYVEVLSSTNVDGLDLTTPPEQSELENPLPHTVTLAVDDTQAVILAGSERKGGIHLALVARAGGDTARPLTAQQEFNQKLSEQPETPTEQESPVGTEAGEEVFHFD